MHLRLALSLLLSTSPDHNYNAALRLYGPFAMFSPDLQLPSKPHNSMTETNDETLRRLGHDLTGIDCEELSSIDTYRLCRNKRR